ncbi:hypothetical protein [Saccharothrix deserti]|uniref:hypothetical protein n=1 Tax=Saccharothrix deserti TaxID=2593674 RepID=UPI00131D63B8|nr:hypothetical protein [Saccharothrix deserti]
MAVTQNDLGSQAHRFLVMDGRQVGVDFAALTAVVRDIVTREVSAAVPSPSDLTAALAASDLAWSAETGDELSTPDYLRHLATTACRVLDTTNLHTA